VDKLIIFLISTVCRIFHNPKAFDEPSDEDISPGEDSLSSHRAYGHDYRRIYKHRKTVFTIVRTTAMLPLSQECV
jgi:hypothetical protein